MDDNRIQPRWEIIAEVEALRQHGCAVCLYFDSKEERCRRRSPRPVLRQRGVEPPLDSYAAHLWVRVEPDRDWCGEGVVMADRVGRMRDGA